MTQPGITKKIISLFYLREIIYILNNDFEFFESIYS